jgi:hypothetical protein
MTREELIQSIIDLHERAKISDFGPLLINREQLARYLSRQNDRALSAIRRLYTAINAHIHRPL